MRGEESWWEERGIQCLHYATAVHKVKKKVLCTNGSKQKVKVCVFHVTTSGVKVQSRLCRVMFGILQNCV